MNNHAIIVTADYKLLPGVKALINGIKYYGNEADFYLLFWDKPDGDFHQYVDSNLRSLDFVFPIDLRELVHDESIRVEESVQVHAEANAKFYLKFWRHYYPAKLLDYDSIAIFDADMLICNNIMDYFEIANKTGRILIPRNTGIYAQEIDNYSETAFSQSYAPPCHSMPLFYDPKKHHEFFSLVPELARKIGRGEMVAINYLFHKFSKYQDLILLPNSLWLGTRWSDLNYEILYGNKGMRHITAAGDRCFSIHGRWWTDEWIKKIPSSDDVGMNNGLLFQEMFTWLGQLYEGVNNE